MNIVLIGYRGTGKTEVGELIAKELGMQYIGMDARIVDTVHMSIPEIVEKYGWPRFRDLESDVATELAELDNVVIDTGGGVIERRKNVEALRQNSVVVWLKASVDTIVARIKEDTERPSLTAAKSFTDEVAEVLEQRIPKYESATEYEIDTDELTLKQVADKIVEIYEERMECG